MDNKIITKYNINFDDFEKALDLVDEKFNDIYFCKDENEINNIINIIIKQYYNIGIKNLYIINNIFVITNKLLNLENINVNTKQTIFYFANTVAAKDYNIYSISQQAILSYAELVTTKLTTVNDTNDEIIFKSAIGVIDDYADKIIEENTFFYQMPTQLLDIINKLLIIMIHNFSTLNKQLIDISIRVIYKNIDKFFEKKYINDNFNIKLIKLINTIYSIDKNYNILHNEKTFFDSVINDILFNMNYDSLNMDIKSELLIMLDEIVKKNLINNKNILPRFLINLIGNDLKNYNYNNINKFMFIANNILKNDSIQYNNKILIIDIAEKLLTISYSYFNSIVNTVDFKEKTLIDTCIKTIITLIDTNNFPDYNYFQYICTKFVSNLLTQYNQNKENNYDNLIIKILNCSIKHYDEIKDIQSKSSLIDVINVATYSENKEILKTINQIGLILLNNNSIYDNDFIFKLMELNSKLIVINNLNNFLLNKENNQQLEITKLISIGNNLLIDFIKNKTHFNNSNISILTTLINNVLRSKDNIKKELLIINFTNKLITQHYTELTNIPLFMRDTIEFINTICFDKKKLISSETVNITINAINYILKEYEYSDIFFLKNVIFLIHNTLINRIELNNITIVFDILTKIINNHPKLFNYIDDKITMNLLNIIFRENNKYINNTIVVKFAVEFVTKLIKSNDNLFSNLLKLSLHIMYSLHNNQIECKCFVNLLIDYILNNYSKHKDNNVVFSNILKFIINIKKLKYVSYDEQKYYSLLAKFIIEHNKQLGYNKFYLNDILTISENLISANNIDHKTKIVNSLLKLINTNCDYLSNDINFIYASYSLINTIKKSINTESKTRDNLIQNCEIKLNKINTNIITTSRNNLNMMRRNNINNQFIQNPNNKQSTFDINKLETNPIKREPDKNSNDIIFREHMEERYAEIIQQKEFLEKITKTTNDIDKQLNKTQKKDNGKDKHQASK